MKHIGFWIGLLFGLVCGVAVAEVVRGPVLVRWRGGYVFGNNRVHRVGCPFAPPPSSAASYSEKLPNYGIRCEYCKP